ncbi:Heavy metal-associated isoprenylated plant protein 17 [Cardamine amara subsp. amara]|uniref:Heavy metal-associated isoprenylated plant protein 17 n=1 Tax=Cardamine amara subsp. amara TaxID=228776 RepID=A0ABD1BTS0_CARAN
MSCCLRLLPPTNIPNNSSNVEFKMPDCDECVKAMTETITKFKGVESCVTDAENQKIVVTGSFNQEKLVKKLFKLTGNEVEIVTEEEKNAESEMLLEQEKELETVVEIEEHVSEEDAKVEEIEKHMKFTEENPKAKCTIC